MESPNKDSFDAYEDVRKFNEKFGFLLRHRPSHLTKRKLEERRAFMQEELDEFAKAAETQDLAELADALVDLVYVALGTAASLGLPWNDLWADVHRANMEKVRGVTSRGNKVDCMKPPGWVPPMGSAILEDAGYKSRIWKDPLTGKVDESLCLDDKENLNL